jgi:hypothetical protein
VQQVDLGEQVASAVAGGNLIWEKGSINRVIALGVAGLRARRDSRRRAVPPELLVRLATMTYRLKLAGDVKEYKAAEDAVCSLASALNRRWNWRSSPSGVRRMSRTVLRYWLVDNCPGCTGRKFQEIPGSPALSARVCQDCGGSGKAPRPWASSGLRSPAPRAREGEYHDALFAELQGVEYDVSLVLRRLLRPWS